MWAPSRQTWSKAMTRSRQVTMSLALFVLICFFLPWVELSCGPVRDSVSGYALARSGHALLWLVPCFMAATVLLGLSRAIWERLPAALAFLGIVGGGISAFLMLRERWAANGSPRLIDAAWAPIFWLGVAAALGGWGAALAFFA